MKNNFVKVAAVIPELRIADVPYNTQQIIKGIKDNRDAGIVVFPELSVTGYTCGDLFGSELLLDRAKKALFEIAKETANIQQTVLVGVPVRLYNSLYNCAAVLSEGEIKALVPKIFIPTYSEFYEHRWFASGRNIGEKTMFLEDKEIPIGTDIIIEDTQSGALLGIEICEDLWAPDKPSTHLALAGANIIANLSASDETIGKKEYRTQLVGQQSSNCYCGYIYVSSATDESSTDMVFSGHTIIAQSGSLIKDTIFPTCPHTETALIDLGRIMHDRAHQNTFENAGAASYRRIRAKMKNAGAAEVDAKELADIMTANDFSVARNPFVPADTAKRAERCRTILQIQANGLATRVKKTGITNLVIGVSGGLDSTLALLVCHEAKKLVPKARIIAYTMPNEGNTSDLTYDNASGLMKIIADEIHVVPIKEGVLSHLSDIGHQPEYLGEGDVTYENAQARMRTYILMDAANMKNGLVVGTGDLSELAMGWCTYNGDHMSMYAVNAGVPKTLVKFICETYADTTEDAELAHILRSICDTPITPELTPNKEGQIAQMTEAKIGKYDLNDFFLFYTLRYGFEPERIVAFAMRAYPELSQQDITAASKNFFRRFFANQFKRSCLPDGPKVGSVTLSPRGDWRMPSDAPVSMWLE